MARNRPDRSRRPPPPHARGQRRASQREDVATPRLAPAQVRVGARDERIDDASIDPLRAVLVITARGGLTIPAAMRRALALDPGGRLLAEATPEGVLLRPATHVAFDPLNARQARGMFAIDLAAVEAFLRKRRRRSMR